MTNGRPSAKHVAWAVNEGIHIFDIYELWLKDRNSSDGNNKAANRVGTYTTSKEKI